MEDRSPVTVAGQPRIHTGVPCAELPTLTRVASPAQPCRTSCNAAFAVSDYYRGDDWHRSTRLQQTQPPSSRTVRRHRLVSYRQFLFYQVDHVRDGEGPEGRRALRGTVPPASHAIAPCDQPRINALPPILRCESRGMLPCSRTTTLSEVSRSVERPESKAFLCQVRASRPRVAPRQIRVNCNLQPQVTPSLTCGNVFKTRWRWGESNPHRGHLRHRRSEHILPGQSTFSGVPVDARRVPGSRKTA